MIALLILTGIAIIVLIIGFFEIQIPFLSRNQLTRKERKEFLRTIFAKEQKRVSSRMKNLKNLLKSNKQEVNFRILNEHKTSDVI